MNAGREHWRVTHPGVWGYRPHGSTLTVAGVRLTNRGRSYEGSVGGKQAVTADSLDRAQDFVERRWKATAGTARRCVLCGASLPEGRCCLCADCGTRAATPCAYER